MRQREQNKTTRLRHLLLSLGVCACATSTAPPSAIGPGDLGAEPTPLDTSMDNTAVSATDQNAPIEPELRGPDDLVRLCELLRDEEAMTFGGTAVARAQARQEHRRRRLKAAGSQYIVVIPGNGFAFGPYDLTERRLIIDIGRPLVLGEGAHLLARPREAPLSFELPAESADVLLKEHAAGRLALRVIFRPATSELRNEPCLRASGGRVVKMEADVLAYAVLGMDGAPRARGQTKEFADESLAASPVVTPEVIVRRPRTADGKDASDALLTSASSLTATLMPCYRTALAKRPNVRGTLVLALKITADGRIEAAHTEMSSLGDEEVASCAIGQVTKIRLGGITSPQRLSVPFVFGSKGDVSPF